MHCGSLIPFGPLFLTSLQYWKHLEKETGIGEGSLKHLKKKSKRRVRKRVSPLREVRAWQPMRHKQIPGELSGPAGRQGAVLCVTCCLRGETDWRYQGAETRYFIFIRCLMSASSRRPLLELRAIEDSCRLPNFWASLYSLCRKIPLLHPQSTPVPGRLFTRDCRKGKRNALQACRGHFSWLGILL